MKKGTNVPAVGRLQKSNHAGYVRAQGAEGQGTNSKALHAPRNQYVNWPGA